MPTLTFRRAEPADLAVVQRLHADATGWLASKELDQWQPGQPSSGTPNSSRRAIERGACYLAHLGHEVIGTLTIDDYADPEFWTPTEQAEPALYLHRMIIARRHAGRDLGRALLDFADELAARAGARWLRLDAWKDNTALHAYYTGQDFQHVRTIDLPHRGSGALFQRPVHHPNPASRADEQRD